jgi:hypothetical protein
MHSATRTPLGRRSAGRIVRACLATVAVTGALAAAAAVASAHDAAGVTASSQRPQAAPQVTPSSTRSASPAPAEAYAAPAWRGLPVPAPSTSSPAMTAPSAPPAPPSDAPPATPSGSPVAPPDDPWAPAGSDECGWWDVECKVTEALDGWFAGLARNAINPVFRMIGASLLATPQLAEQERVRQMWTWSAAIANACFVLLVVAGGITLMTHQTLQTSYTVKDIAPRMVVAMVAANVSLLLAGKGIEFANALSAALLAPGVDPQQAGQTMAKTLTSVLDENPGVFFAFMVLGTVVLGVILLLIYMIRVMLTVLVLAAAPLMLACHALPQTEMLAQLWWRCLGGLLAIQVVQALVFITAMRVYFSHPDDFFGLPTPSHLLDQLLIVCLLYILVRIPSWISRLIWQGGMLRRSPVTRTARTVAAIVVYRRLLGSSARRSPPPAPHSRGRTP